MACPAGTTRGPSIQPRSMAFFSATSRSSPPVCMNRPRLRTVVKPARSVRRALATARRVRTAGSSWTAFRGLRWSGPPRSRLTSMSMRPGKGHVAQVDDGRVVRHPAGADLHDAVALRPAGCPVPARLCRRRACGRCGAGCVRDGGDGPSGAPSSVCWEGGLSQNQYMDCWICESRKYRSKPKSPDAGDGEVRWNTNWAQRCCASSEPGRSPGA